MTELKGPQYFAQLLEEAAGECGIALRLAGAGQDAPRGTLLGGFVQDPHRTFVRCDCTECATKPVLLLSDDSSSEQSTRLMSLVEWAYHASGAAMDGLELALEGEAGAEGQGAEGHEDGEGGAEEALLAALPAVVFALAPRAAAGEARSEAGDGGALPLSAFWRQAGEAAGGASLVGRRVWVHVFTAGGEAALAAAAAAEAEAKLKGADPSAAAAAAQSAAALAAAGCGPRWYSCRLVGYDPASGTHQVEFDPGQRLEEWQLEGEDHSLLHLATCHVHVGDQPPPAASAAAAGGGAGVERPRLDGAFANCLPAVPSDVPQLVASLLPALRRGGGGSEQAAAEGTEEAAGAAAAPSEPTAAALEEAGQDQGLQASAAAAGGTEQAQAQAQAPEEGVAGGRAAAAAAAAGAPAVPSAVGEAAGVSGVEAQVGPPAGAEAGAAAVVEGSTSAGEPGPGPLAATGGPESTGPAPMDLDGPPLVPTALDTGAAVAARAAVEDLQAAVAGMEVSAAGEEAPGGRAGALGSATEAAGGDGTGDGSQAAPASGAAEPSEAAAQGPWAPAADEEAPGATANAQGAGTGAADGAESQAAAVAGAADAPSAAEQGPGVPAEPLDPGAPQPMLLEPTAAPNVQSSQPGPGHTSAAPGGGDRGAGSEGATPMEVEGGPAAAAAAVHAPTVASPGEANGLGQVASTAAAAPQPAAEGALTGPRLDAASPPLQSAAPTQTEHSAIPQPAAEQRPLLTQVAAAKAVAVQAQAALAAALQSAGPLADEEEEEWEDPAEAARLCGMLLELEARSHELKVPEGARLNMMFAAPLAGPPELSSLLMKVQTANANAAASAAARGATAKAAGTQPLGQR